ncbi:3-oxoacyl-ACP synthase [Paenibacillus psychroresistens]|uniref:3-oxoacyl-ACP synthase n=1 Tax=Paenibacillus psychroresistens TaxID=1778678 RepID=A0A6B8RK82_9BACL|nr:beta-ketoacyl-ACP synthase III [Paenibacillus psychroresistens]QGQ96449.1 3-oxoacyl-ACP synthase [Paenibacillus psychroresistens]
MNNKVYITALGKFLPGAPIANDEMEDYLGRIGGKPSKAKKRVLDQNGIKSRHYAIDKQQNSLYSNAEMAAFAIKDSMRHVDFDQNQMDFLAVATAQADLILPGFASMVHAELGTPPCELANLFGICVTGMTAIKSAYLQVKTGEKQYAVACASEFPSRVFKSSRYEAQAKFRDGDSIPFDTDFLRFMLSDGAGAAVLQDHPSPHGLSLQIEWIDIKSHASQYEPCMYSGANKTQTGEMDTTWLDYPTFQEAADAGALNVKQDIRLVQNMPKLGVDGFFRLIDEGKIAPNELDWIVCHYSSDFFRAEIFKLLNMGGLNIPEDKWFTNLYTKGNTGSASIYIMLEEMLNEGKLKMGQKICCIVPESGRFMMAYMMLTVVGPTGNKNSNPEVPEIRVPEAPHIATTGTETQEWLVRQLVRVWIDFESKLNQVPIIHKLNAGKFTLEDYKILMENIRQQVVEGSQWIARAASNVSIDLIDIRSMFIAHASDEHRDYQMLEKNYVSVGGNLKDIISGEKNVGSEALSAYMFQRASRENPFDLLGGMFIVEGLGNRMAKHWGTLIRDQLGLRDDQVSFLLYHSVSDINHFDRLEKSIQSDILTMQVAEKVVKTAKVTARLYLLQLEELGNI